MDTNDNFEFALQWRKEQMKPLQEAINFGKRLKAAENVCKMCVEYIARGNGITTDVEACIEDLAAIWKGLLGYESSADLDHRGEEEDDSCE